MYLVTGGAGFIGSNIVEALVSRGQRVRVLDDFSNGLRSNLEPFGEAIEVAEGDIRDLEVCRRASQGIEAVFHLAALGSVPRSIEDPLTSDAVNCGGTLNVLVAARDAGVRRVVYSSSSAVYGSNPALPKHEELATMPISPYAVSKLAAEWYARVFAEVYGIETVALRYFNVFGPRQRPDAAYAAVIPLFMRGALNGKTVTVYGDGEQSRDFTFVENVVQANLLAANATDVSGRVFNVACGTRFSLLDILAHLEVVSGRKIDRVHELERPGDIRHSEADIGSARESLGYQVAVDFRDGLSRTWERFSASYA